MPHASGERHYAAKLTRAKVVRLRDLHNTPCEHCGQRLTVRALARMFGVAKGTAGHAITGRNWDIPADHRNQSRSGGGNASSGNPPPSNQ